MIYCPSAIKLPVSMPLSTIACMTLAVFLQGLGVPAIAAEKYDQPQTFKASEILPAKVLSGPNHKVDEKVFNDGYLYHYTIESPFGTTKAISTATLYKRIDELNAVVRMEKIKGTDEFKSGIVEKGKDVVEGATNLITDPVNTVSNAVSGVGKLFHRAGQNLMGNDRSDAESSRTEQLIGFAKTKRDYAFDFKVDVYSRNKVMQKSLDDLAWAGYAGNMSMSALLMAVPGGAGTALSVTGGTHLMEKVFHDKPPTDLRSMNREKLKAMGVHEDIIDLYISNGVFTPREQTLLVASLDDMKNTKDRGNFIKFSIPTDNADVAAFRQRQAAMYTQFNRKVKPIHRFAAGDNFASGLLEDGTLIFVVPLDNLLWTESMARFISGADKKLKSLPEVTGTQIWVAGKMSPLARKEIEARGWKVFEQGGGKLTVVQ